jgi:hypothetical protein
MEGRVEIESEWTAKKRERAAGRICLPAELPHSSQKRRLEWATRPENSPATIDEDFPRDVEEAVAAHREPLNPPAWD